MLEPLEEIKNISTYWGGGNKEQTLRNQLSASGFSPPTIPAPTVVLN